MPLLVDASNVLLAEGALSPDFAGPTLEELTSYIARSRFGREVVWIVCDHRVVAHLNERKEEVVVLEDEPFRARIRTRS